MVSSSWFYIILGNYPLLRKISHAQSFPSTQTKSRLTQIRAQEPHRVNRKIRIPVQFDDMASLEKFEMMTSRGYTIQFFHVPPQKVEFSQQFCPTCCRLYRNNVGFRGSHQPIRLMCGHKFCLGCELTRVDSLKDPMSACDKCHPDTNKPRSSSQKR